MGLRRGALRRAFDPDLEVRAKPAWGRGGRVVRESLLTVRLPHASAPTRPGPQPTIPWTSWGLQSPAWSWAWTEAAERSHQLRTGWGDPRRGPPGAPRGLAGAGEMSADPGHVQRPHSVGAVLQPACRPGAAAR